MKKLILLLSLITLSTQAQDGISFSVLQDVKLGLGLDKAHLNDTPTLDLIINVNLEGKQFEYSYFTIQMQYEYADLHDNWFSRYSVNALWTLNPLLLPKMEMSFGFGLGIINRENLPGLGNYSGILELRYPISKIISLIGKNEWVRRPDLDMPKTNYNLSFGLRYKPFK